MNSLFTLSASSVQTIRNVGLMSYQRLVLINLKSRIVRNEGMLSRRKILKRVFGVSYYRFISSLLEDRKKEARLSLVRRGVISANVNMHDRGRIQNLAGEPMMRPAYFR